MMKILWLFIETSPSYFFSFLAVKIWAVFMWQYPRVYSLGTLPDVCSCCLWVSLYSAENWLRMANDVCLSSHRCTNTTGKNLCSGQVFGAVVNISCPNVWIRDLSQLLFTTFWCHTHWEAAGLAPILPANHTGYPGWVLSSWFQTWPSPDHCGNTGS